MLLSLCKQLLMICLPKRLADNIIGDIEEEYSNLVKQSATVNNADQWLLKQTLLICLRFIFTSNNLLIALVSFFGLSLFTLVVLGVIWLANIDDPTVLSVNFWENFLTASHVVFFEPAFWHYAPQALSDSMNLSLWLDFKAFIYSIISLILLRSIDKRFFLHINVYTLLALSLMFLPYIWGSMQFLLYKIPLKETGQIIATMWFSILYMILPVSWVLIGKLRSSVELNNC